MSIEMIRAYQDTVMKQESAQRTVENYVRTITNASRLLADWRSVGVSNSGVGFPPEAIFSNKSINADEWPNAKQLAEALSAWHNAHHDAVNAYNAIPEASRRVVVPPER